MSVRCFEQRVVVGDLAALSARVMIECLIVILTQEKFNTTENETAAEVSMKYKSKRDDCRERIHDNRRSHFQFGSNVDFKHSEQVICGLTLMITVYFFLYFRTKIITV